MSSAAPRLHHLQRLAPRAEFPVTICALFYGDHAGLCRRLLDSFYRHTDARAFHLRAGLNAVCAETAKLVRLASETYGNITIYHSRRNIRKCPMMRRLFHDPPIVTPWTIWFDDDSFVIRADWLLALGLAIESHPKVDVWGEIYRVTPSTRIRRFIQTSSWSRGRPLLKHANGEPYLEFAVGGFWAVRSRFVYEVDWPDHRIVHFEDDYLFGEALRQHGAVMGQNRSGVVISDAPRRGPQSGESLRFPR